MNEIIEKLAKPIETKTRPGTKKGVVFTYFPVRSVIKRLNEVFGLTWNFSVKEHIITKDNVAVLVRLEYLDENERLCHKEQFGGKKYEDSISLADNLKAAASAGLKKVAESIGIQTELDDETDEITEEQFNKIKTHLEKEGIFNEKAETMLKEMSKADAEGLMQQLEIE